MIQRLNDIKDYILNKRNFYNSGYANVSKPSGNNVIVDNNFQYVGIQDNLGNYFYIRSLKEVKYTPFVTGCRIQSYKTVTSCRMVAIGHNINEDILLLSILNDLSANRVSITSSNTEKTEVFYNETGNRKITDTLRSMTIVSVDFEIIDNVVVKDCELNPTTC